MRKTKYIFLSFFVFCGLGVFLGTGAAQAAVAGDVIINEIMWTGSSTSTADEWIELRNASNTAIDLVDWIIDNASSGAALTIDATSCSPFSTSTIPAGGYYLIARYASTSVNSLLNANIQCVASSLILNDNYQTNDALFLKQGATVIDGTPATTTTAWPAGSTSTVAYSSMARDWGNYGAIGNGTDTLSWHTSIFAGDWDSVALEKGTPGIYNGYSVSGTISQLNADASGTVYVVTQDAVTHTTIATYLQNIVGTYQMHLVSSTDFGGEIYDFFAFRDINGNGLYDASTEPRRTLDNSGAGYNLTSSGFSNIDFTLTVNPVITSVTPSSTNIGATITIAGSYFGDSTTTAQGYVWLPTSSIDAGNNIQSWSSTSIAIRIPAPTAAPGVQTGVLNVQIGSWAPWATTTLTIKPKITSAAATTKTLIINFDSFIDGQPAMVSTNYTLQSPTGTTAKNLSTAWTEFRGNKTYIKGISLVAGATFTITAGANIKSLADTSVDTASNSWSGTVISGPTITSVSPGSGTAGATVVIAGTGFGATAGTVYFSSGPPTIGPPPPPVQATVSTWSSNSIQVTVPAGAKTGPIFLITNDGTESEFSQNAFFNTLASANFRVLEANTNNVISASTTRIVVGSMGGPQLYYVGDSNSTSYSAGTTTIPNVSSSGFTWAFDSTGVHVSSRGKELNTATTTVFTLATSVARIIGTISGASANRTIVVWLNPLEGSAEWKEPIFAVTNANGTTSYSVGLSATGIYVIGVQDPGFGTSASSNPIIGPSPVTVNASSTATSTVNFAFQTATARIHGKIEKGGGTSFDVGPGMDAFHIWAYQPIANGFSASAMPDANGEFDIYANPGIYIIGAGGPNLPSPTEQQIEVLSGNANFALTNAITDITLVIKAPDGYISGTVTDNNGNALSGASIFAWRQEGQGGGQAFTDSSGAYKLYVAPGTYTVEGFAPQFGKLTARTGISVVSNCQSNSSCPSVDFGVSSDLATISGTVTKNSAAVADIDVWITAGETGYGVNGTRTGSDGTYSLTVPYAAGYWIHAAQPGKGEIYRISLPTFNSNTSTSTNNITINTATVNVRISPVSAFSQAFVEIKNTTSTHERGFSDKDTGATSSYRQYSIEVPKPTNNETWTYLIQGGIPGFGPLTPTSTAISSTTQSATINIALGSVWQVSGAISNAEGAFVWAASPAGHGGGQVNSSGTFSFTLKQGTYDFGVDKKGYTGNILSSQPITADASITGLTLSSAGLAISGTVSISSVAESGAWVWGTNGAGGWTGSESDGNGTYTLNVTAGTWQIKAVSEGYESTPQSVSISSGTTTLNLSLSAMSGYTVATPTVASIVPRTGGIVTGDRVTVDAPAGALDSQDSNTGRISIQKTTSVPQTNGVKPLGNAAYSISVANSSGTAITVLNDSITITLTYTAAELAAAGISQASSSQLSLGYWDSLSNTWTTISTNAATSSDGGVTYTGTTNHLSDYAPLVSSGSNPPPTPTGFTAAAGNGQITLSWSVSSLATKYYIYRKSGDNYPYLSQTIALTYTNTGLTNGTTYYYKISALNADNDESTSTDAVSAIPAEPPGPAAGSSYTYVPPATTTTPVATTTPAVTPTAPVTKPISQMTATELQAEIVRIVALIAHLQAELAKMVSGEKFVGIPANFTFKTTLKSGMTSNEVKYLQIILNSNSDTKVADSGLGSAGQETTKFGFMTKGAVVRFQEKYRSEILTPLGLTEGTGLVGSATRAKLNKLLGR